MQANSCCWVPTVNYVNSWILWTHVDLGIRSDTNAPNRSPLTTILPLIRVPQNCPRTYHIMAFDSDGDKVRCRYGLQQNSECYTCDQPSGFHLNQGACTLEYSSTYNTGVYGFELVLEDFPKKHTTLAYSDGSRSYRCPLGSARQNPSAYYTTPYTTSTPSINPYWWWWYQQQTTTTPPTTTEPPSTTEPPTTTETSTTTPWWWNHQQNNVATTTPSWWWWQNQQNTMPPTPVPWGWWNYNQQPTTPPMTTPGWYWPQTTTSHQRSYEPLSKIPLQFSFLVDPPAPSCTEGLYIPHFLSPTPQNGEKIHAAPLRELEIRVKATAAYTTVHDVIISGPLNITKHALSTGEYAIRWTPMRDDLGESFPICFIAEASDGANIYQSEMRCIIVNVGRHNVNAHVTCTGTNMVVEIEQQHSIGLHKDFLRLNDPACTLNSNDTHVSANISLNACGTLIEEDERYIIFKNEIVSTDDLHSIITRKHEVEIEFSCRYEKSNNISMEFTARRNIYTVTEKGFGTLTYNFGLFPTADYTAMMNSYPAEFDLGDRIYMQIESQSSINDTELFVESCVATPYNDPSYPTPYTIIQNGCALDGTVEFYTSHEPTVRFSLEAFKFIGLHDQVFISCSVILCEAYNPFTRCSQGCTNSTVSPPSHHHHRREAAIETASHLISQGPLRLKRSVEREVTSTALNLNLVFIAGCLLAAVGMVCGVLIYRTRRPQIKYQPLQSSEI
ncbi:uncharacterized protein LOC130436055 [Triplophysa dalaica]|uniref:uncharacterized protein LOC130436055 n=1 Tax=Triplophysa dalaica TaxID=1582913 RepID=UPI0024E007F8|nr:uncharacterized protein LOC130436055 [Triplophysa dalaica]